MTIPILAKLQKAFVGTEGLVDAVDVDVPAPDGEGNLTTSVTDVALLAQAVNSLPIEGSSQFYSLLSALLAGATVTTDHVDSRVELSNNITNWAVDYRDTAEGDLNDATHYNTNGVVTISSNNAAYTIALLGGNHTRRKLIAIKLNVDTARTNTGAIVELYGSDNTTGNQFIRVNSSRNIEVTTNPAAQTGVQNLGSAAGTIVLNDNTDYWCLFEIIERGNDPDSFEMITSILAMPESDPTNTTLIQANDINLDLTGITATVVGLSRVTSDVARVVEWKMAEQSSYLSHTALANLVRNHTADKWFFGYARLFEGSDANRITLGNNVEFAADLRYQDGKAINKSELVVFQAVGTADANLSSAVTLPANYADYNYVHVTEYDKDTSQWRHTEFPTIVLSSGHISAGDNVRLQGNTLMNWVLASRQLAMNPLVTEIYRVALKD